MIKSWPLLKLENYLFIIKIKAENRKNFKSIVTLPSRNKNNILTFFFPTSFYWRFCNAELNHIVYLMLLHVLSHLLLYPKNIFITFYA